MKADSAERDVMERRIPEAIARQNRRVYHYWASRQVGRNSFEETDGLITTDNPLRTMEDYHALKRSIADKFFGGDVTFTLKTLTVLS